MNWQELMMTTNSGQVLNNTKISVPAKVLIYSTCEYGKNYMNCFKVNTIA